MGSSRKGPKLEFLTKEKRIYITEDIVRISSGAGIPKETRIYLFTKYYSTEAVRIQQRNVSITTVLWIQHRELRQKMIREGI